MLQITVASQNFFEIITRIAHAVLELVHLVFNLLQAAECRQGRFVNG